MVERLPLLRHVEVAAALLQKVIMEVVPERLAHWAVPVWPLRAALLALVVVVGVEVDHLIAGACLFSCSISH